MLNKIKEFIGMVRLEWYINVTFPRQLNKMERRIRKDLQDSFKNIKW